MLASFPGLLSPNTVEGLVKLLHRMMSGRRCIYNHDGTSHRFQTFLVHLSGGSLCRTPFSNVVRMRTRSLVPKPKTTVIGLGARLVDVNNHDH